MNRKLLKLSIAACVTIFLSCEMDGFLFNNKKSEKYELPGNTIPEYLIHPVTLKSETYTLYGFWIDSKGSGLTDVTVLYCHGNKHGIDEYWERVMYLHELGVNIFIFDYRGYGRSEGESSEAGLYQDGAAALDYVLTQRGVTPEKLCVYGYSLGNVVSIYLAAEKVNPRCLIAECPFASANSLTQSSTVLDIPEQWLTKGTFDNAEKIKKIHAPLLLMHGDADDFVRCRDNGKVIFENAPEPKQMQIVVKANHTDIPEIMGVQNYLDLIRDWIVR